ncbi:MAG TPA: branched-chain amino acid transporter [Succinivibrionaceae bacterium]|nr:AzlD domain-containing protein [Succinivibrio sp.]HAR79595.1 branched-chain amino acid transporter [Succinivibrionaceae bacterium]
MSQEMRFFVIIVMVSLVTYFLKMVPSVFVSKLRITGFWQRFFDLIPYTALTALVFPGIFYCLGNENLYVAYAGSAVAVACSFVKLPAAAVVIIAVIAVYLLLVAFPA